jgi:adenine-specific DNA-methyltransferase
MPTLDFKGKQFVYAHHLTVPFRQLNVDAKKSLPNDGKPSLDDNLIIHGDNLHALKALLPKYAGRVDCIFIDPPYNTGNEGWCYSDNVNSPLIREWLKDSANPVDKEDLERHDKWLCMMWPRLQLLRELLSNDGTIWITLDDNEVYRARSILDEIFGVDNFLANISWVKRYTRSNNAKMFYSMKDAVIAYRKSELLDTVKEPRNEKSDSGYDNPDKDLRGPWMTSSYVNPATKEERRNLVYPLKNPFTGKKVEHPTHAWKYQKEEHDRHVEEKLLWWGSDGKAEYPRLKLFLEGAEKLVPVDVWNYSEVGSSDDGGNEVKTVFGSAVFDNPKPTGLIKKILSIVGRKNAVVLDSFAGSGTTAHAVLALNKEDSGSRKVILVQINEATKEDSSAYKAGYKNVIEITAERVRRVIKGVKDAKDDDLKKGLGGSFTFCELGEEINIENLLKSEKLPIYDELARYAFYTATGQTLDKVKHGADFLVGETANYRVYVIYQPDTHFLRSQESALNMALAERISKALKESKKTALVFATHKFMGQKELSEMGIVYCQLPYAIHRVMGD